MIVRCVMCGNKLELSDDELISKKQLKKHILLDNKIIKE